MSTWSEHLPDVDNVHRTLGITETEISPQRVVLSLNVTPAVHQPFGLLHGGVSALLAEGAASIGGAVSVDSGHYVVGTELNCSHLRPVTAGVIRAVATPVRQGRTVQVWAVEILDEQDQLICVARCSLQVRAVSSPTA